MLQIEGIVSEVLAHIFGQRAHVLLAEVREDPNGWRYVDAVWMISGTFRVFEGTLHEGSVHEDLALVPNEVRTVLIATLHNQPVDHPFTAELRREILPS